MKTSYKQYSNRRYLAQVDFPYPETLPIVRVTEELVSARGKPDQLKLIVFLKGKEKGLVLNTTNGEKLEKLTRQRYPEVKDPDNPRRWMGLVVTIGVNPNVMYGPDRTGGLRLWEPDNDEPPIEWGDEGDDEPQEKPVAKQKPKPSAPRPVRPNKRLPQQPIDEPASDELADQLAETKRSRP